MSSAKTQQRLSLRQMVEITGLSEFTLRGWEQRHKALSPERTETGRRLYRPADLKKALALRELTERGEKIGDIAHLSENSLDRLLNGEAIVSAAGNITPAEKRLLAFVESHSWNKLETALDRASQECSAFEFISKVILPLMRVINIRVSENLLSIAQEHIVSALVKEKIYRIAGAVNNRRPFSPLRIVFATPAGDMHEIGLLISYALARAEGAQTLYLGANTPKRDLCEASLRFGATHILLSCTVSSEEGTEDLYSYINYLDRHLFAPIELWLGGRSTSDFEARLERPMRVFGDFEDLNSTLRGFREKPKKGVPR